MQCVEKWHANVIQNWNDVKEVYVECSRLLWLETYAPFVTENNKYYQHRNIVESGENILIGSSSTLYWSKGFSTFFLFDLT